MYFYFTGSLTHSVTQSYPTLCDHMDTRLLHPWDFLGKGTGVGCHFLLQGIFPTQGSNSGLPHCRQTLYCLSHQGGPYWIPINTKKMWYMYMKKSERVSCSVVSDSLRPHGLQPSRLLCPQNSPGKNTGVDCHFLLQGSSQSRDQTWSLTLQADPLLSEPPYINTNTHTDIWVCVCIFIYLFYTKEVKKGILSNFLKTS